VLKYIVNHNLRGYMTNKKYPNLVCVDDSSAKGEYNTLSKQDWELYKIIENAPNRFRVPEKYVNRELRIYANIETVENQLDKSTKYKLSKGHWRDIRKSQTTDRGKPFTVIKDKIGGIIWMPVICRNKRVRIYIERCESDKEEANNERDINE